MLSTDRTTSLAQVREALAAALRREAGEVQRLTYAQMTVSVRIAGEPGGVTVLLDPDRPDVVEGTDGDVVLELTPELADRFVHGELPMPAAVLTGQVTASGPVRRYLEVDPILRGLLADVAGNHRVTARERGRAGAPRLGGLDPALLAIETRDLYKRFDDQEVLRGLDIRIPEGVISVVLGPSGTGKSVLLQHVIGLMRPDAGDVLIRGRPLSGMSRAELLDLRTEIGVMFQDGALFSAMTVYDNVAFPLRQHTDLYEHEIHDIVMEHLGSVGLATARDRTPNQLSGGMRKRAGLARGLALNPGILLCDEPDSGLDPVRTALLGELLVEQHARYGGTMVVVTHNVMLARLIAEHMSVIWQGRVLESGLAEHLLASDKPFVQQFLSGDSHGPLGMDA
jgi:phospholipid/cholesterol/gamma-HCH transport system ATP-binding protein